MLIRNLVSLSFVFAGIAIGSVVNAGSENESATVMTFEDKLLAVLELSDHQDQFSQDDFLLLLDSGLELGYQPGSAFAPVLEVLADQPGLLNETLQKLQVYNISYVYS